MTAERAIELLRHSARISPILRDAVDEVDAELRRLEPRVSRHLDILDHFCRVAPDLVLERMREHRPISWDGFRPLDCESCGEPWPCSEEATRRETGQPIPPRCPTCGGYWDKTTYDRTSSDHPAPLSCADPWHAGRPDVRPAPIESDSTTSDPEAPDRVECDVAYDLGGKP